MVGSLVAAILIVALVVTLVTAKIGPGADSQEIRERRELQEERREAREERREERQERREDNEG
jgi:uncharacterized membrane protein (DUF106 family)